jgi:hypothetical protein
LYRRNREKRHVKKIERLTPEQVARFPEYVKRWTDIGLATAPADRPAAEVAIRESYRLAGLDGPKRIVWCGSPLSQGLTRAIVLDQGDKIRREMRASVRASVWASVWASVRASVRASVYGQHDAGWLAFYAFFREQCGLDEQTAKLAGLLALAKSAGWALPHRGICWVRAYCLSDVAQTAGVWLRLQLARGHLTRELYIAATRSLIGRIDADERLETLSERLDRGRLLLGEDA